MINDKEFSIESKEWDILSALMSVSHYEYDTQSVVDSNAIQMLLKNILENSNNWNK